MGEFNSATHVRPHTYRRYFPPNNGQLKEQLRRLVTGEELLSNGSKPAVCEDEDEEGEGDPDAVSS